MKSTFNMTNCLILHILTNEISFLHAALFICVRYWFDIFKNSLRIKKFHAKKSDWISKCLKKKKCKSCWLLVSLKRINFYILDVMLPSIIWNPYNENWINLKKKQTTTMSYNCFKPNSSKNNNIFVVGIYVNDGVAM